MQREFIQTSFGKLSYLKRDGNYPLIFLHGLGGTGNSFLKLNPYLKENIALFMLDMLGHGKSDKPMIDYTIEVQKKVLKEFIDNMGFEKFSLMGNSYGGWVSMRFSIDIMNPDKLILEDSAGINITYGEVAEDVRRQFINNILKNNPGNEEYVIESIIRNNANPKWKIKDEEFDKIKSPTCIIWGDNDRIIPLSYGEELNKKIKNSKLEIIKDGGHVPHYRKPQEVARVINGFLGFP